MRCPPPAATWPFWAPSDLESVEAALDLARVEPGDRVADLGCGDGQVLVAAARRGAEVVGVEFDPELATLAREALESRSLHGDVVEGDLFETEVEADVYFTYLAPASLQRLVPGLRSRRGARLVTVDFAVPGLIADEVVGPAHLYRLPGRRRRPRKTTGWGCEGALVIASPGCQSLTVLDLYAAGGPVEVAVDGEIAEAVSVFTGADEARAGQHVAVDLRWEEHTHGTLLRGTVLEARGPTLTVTVVFDEKGEEGCWELTDEGVQNVERFLACHTGEVTAAAIVAAAEGS